MSRTEQPARPTLTRVAGLTLGGIYVLGTWVYGTWYVWEYWSRDMGFGLLAWHGFMRALIWPVWVALALIQG